MEEEDSIKTKKYIAEIVVDAKDSSIHATLDDANTYYQYIRRYLNNKQDNYSVESLFDTKLVGDETHIFIILTSKIHDINMLFDFINKESSLSYVEVMTSADHKLWGDVIRLYQHNYFKKLHEEQTKINDQQLQDEEGWIPLEKLQEGLKNNHITIKESGENNEKESNADNT